MKTVKTRIAPSPTGDPHVGTAYIALFNMCFAHQHGGKFVLRIEDTDQARSTEKSEAGILEALRWLGLDWDEGPGQEGDCGPYRQSERGPIYQQHIEQLLQDGHAFHCFCTPQRLDELRRQQMESRQQPGYDGHCLNLDASEIAKRIADGEEHVIRMKVPVEGESVFEDMLRGEVAISWAQTDMQVLIKSDGLPTYHFANVVDDHLMGITHVIRGEEWINSTPKHVLLYEYFGWEKPQFCHMPLLRNPDKSKLSKRKNPTSIGYYQAMGYLPEALLNYLGMMGWSLPSGEEKFSLEQMKDAFDINRVSLGGPIFDIEKLDWLNGKYIREDLDDETFLQAFLVWAGRQGRLSQIAPLVKQRVERFSDVADIGAFFFSADVDISPASFEHKSLDAEQCKRILQFTLWKLEQQQNWGRDDIEASLVQLSASLNLKIRDFLFPVFVAVSGRAASVSVMDAIAILGLDIIRARLRSALAVLGGISKKQAKNLDKEFQSL